MSEKTKKYTIRLYEGDTEKLQAMYPELGYNQVIRMLIRDFINRVEAQARHEDKAIEDINLNIEPSLEESNAERDNTE